MTWQLDPHHSSLTISARHMMITTVRATLAVDRADIEFDPQAPERSSVTAVIDAASIDSGVAARDEHLRSPDFLDVTSHPTIEFRSTAIEGAGAAWKIHGDLTIRGVTRPVVLDAELLGVVPDMRGGRRLAVRAATSFSREAWGLNWNVALEAGGWLVSKEFGVEIEIAAIGAQASAAADAA